MKPAASVTATGADAAASASLSQLFADEQAFTWNEDPLTASYDGQREHDDRLDSALPADHERRARACAKFLERLHAIDCARLGGEDQVSYDLFDFILTYRLKFAAYKEWRAPLYSDSGFHTAVMQMHEAADTGSVAGYARYIARLHDVQRCFAENIANMRQGLKDGYTLPADILPGVASVIDAQQFANPEDSPLYEPFKAFPRSIPASDQARLKGAGKAAIRSAVIPAFRDFQAFFRDEYMPGARRTIGASALPDGRAYYADLVRYYATDDTTPDEVHAIGLGEIARIRAQMEEAMNAATFAGSFADFLAFLRNDPQFYAQTPLALLKDASYLAKEIDGKLPRYFGKLPRTPYRVEAVPATLAPNYTAGRYNPGPNDGRTPGSYWVNTYALDRRPLYSLPALTLHEAVPGHHLQIALARELTDLPAFRRNSYLSAFGEGWALYCEKLGVEMEMYKTPYEDFGRLSYEMWRACRLVVDTGMHWKDWSREQALDYLRGNTTLSEHEVRTEIDRYIAWPGQALSYKLGEIRICALRRKAEQALGAKFDLRAFHDAVLAEGTITLPMLERRIDAYVAASGSVAAS
ncbi:MAG TPA: DUF885 domain-containing protein [Casimicrobiaceae bacterium]|nr:DUF885 domain-containing protein [Casimicrobiaceae bacterium]